MDNINANKLNTEPSETKHYYIESVRPNGGACYRFLRRAFDIIVSFVAGVILLPAMLVIAVLICVDSPGGVIYRQERLKKDGKSFFILKFRTMGKNAESYGPRWADTNDPRCTKIGAKLRKTRLDELPQLWNIFKGDMSFVGPRPERPCFYEEFETYIHGFKNRMAVTPGLTGLAQVSGGYDLSPEEKIVYDMEYIKTRSIWLDIKILFKTFRLIFTHEGAR